MVKDLGLIKTCVMTSLRSGKNSVIDDCSTRRQNLPLQFSASVVGLLGGLWIGQRHRMSVSFTASLRALVSPSNLMALTSR